MDWLTDVAGFWLVQLAWLAGLAAAFGVVGRRMPCNPGMFWWNDLRAAGTDLLYWFVVPLFLRLGRAVLLVVGLLMLFGGREPAVLPVKDLPLAVQAGLVLLLQDVLLYGIHRAFHTRWAWDFHAVHHSPRVLDWMSTQRFHPVNDLLAFTLADVVVLLLGFSPAAVVALAPFNVLYSAMVHANLNWTFGPLRHVFASPVFHRWHHTTRADGRDKNFASTFPVLDLLFGTYYLPPDRLPEEFGSGDPDFPEGFWGQFLHPFRAWAPRRAAARRTAIGLSAASLLGSALYFAARRTDREEQPLPPPPPTPTWPDNGLAGAAAGDGAPGRPECRVFRSHAGAVLGVALSADGGRVASAGADGTVRVCDAATGEELLALRGHAGAVAAVALAGDGRSLVSGGADGTVRVWDPQTGQEQHTLRGPGSSVLGVALRGDGRRIAAGSAYQCAELWDPAAGREPRCLAADAGAVPGVALDGAGHTLVTAGGRTAKLWDADAGRELRTLTGHADLVWAVALSADGRRVVTGSFDRTLRLWDADTARQRRTFTGHTGAVLGVALSADGRRVVSGSKDRTVRVWDAVTGEELHTFAGHTDSVTGVAVSADGRRVASASRDGTLRLWDVPAPRMGIAEANTAGPPDPLLDPSTVLGTR